MPSDPTTKPNSTPTIHHFPSALAFSLTVSPKSTGVSPGAICFSIFPCLSSINRADRQDRPNASWYSSNAAASPACSFPMSIRERLCLMRCTKSQT